jgi:hypothetical protein
VWNDLVKHLAAFSSAVLTGVDAAGYPFSLRCQPVPDAEAQVLRVTVPAYANLQPGPAGLLCHQHDAWLWQLKSFLVRGALVRDAQGWVFRPEQLTPGAGIGGLLGMVNFVQRGRRTAQQYLTKRQLARPRIAWDQIQALWAESKRLP